jgi:hypothetical protein
MSSHYVTRGTYDDGRHFLNVVDAPAPVRALFDSLGLQGGGYTWVAVLQALAKLAEPPIEGEFEIDGEADNAYINASDSALIDAFEKLIARAMEDLDLLRRALDEADPDLLE